MTRERAVILLATLWLGACHGVNEQAQPEPTPAKITPPSPEPTPSEPAPRAPTPPAPYEPDPAGFGDACGEASACGWDDACVPSRCVGAEHVGAEIACEETAPPPGTCACVLGHCALRPNADLEPPPVSCKLSGCGLDEGAGKCVEATMQDANRGIRHIGPACHCDDSSLLCEFTWVEQVACESVEQCWVSDSGPYHPIPRPAKLRGRKFRPCKDGEIAPACKDGFCTVVAYKC